MPQSSTTRKCPTSRSRASFGIQELETTRNIYMQQVADETFKAVADLEAAIEMGQQAAGA
jgi:hypothetical protein